MNLDLIRLMSSSSSKGPAGSTLTLIFDSSDNSAIPPINISFKACINFLNNGVWCMRSSFSKISIDKLLLSKICKLVNCHFPGMSGIRVMFLDLFDCRFEDSYPVLEFRWWWNILAEFVKIGQILCFESFFWKISLIRWEDEYDWNCQSTHNVDIFHLK